MKGSNIIQAIQNLKLAAECFDDFCREHPQTKGSALFKSYRKKIDWIHQDMITHPQLPNVVREGIKREINSDIFAIPAIHEKIALLNPKHREVLEQFIDELLSKPIN